MGELKSLMHPAFFALALLASISASQGRAGTHTYEHRPLVGAELREAVSGKFIKLAFPPEMKLPVYPERFNPDGTYVSYGDNEEQVGRYWFKADRVCVVAEHTERHCRYLFLGSDGRYWISDTRNPTDSAPVSIKAIR